MTPLQPSKSQEENRHWAHKLTLGMHYHIIWIFPLSPMVQASALGCNGWLVDWLIHVTYCTHEVHDCMAKGASIWSFHLHGISYNVWCNWLQVVGDKWWWFWDNTCRKLRKKEIMGHAWPLTRTCGQTVPTFRVTWVLSPSWVLQAGKAQRMVNQPTLIISGLFPKYPRSSSSCCP